MKNSAIEWCHHTMNPWVGCTEISPGCTNCYARVLDHRWGKDRWGKGKPRTMTKTWREPMIWDRDAKKAGVRARVFCASMADVFDEEVPDTWRYKLFNLIAATPNLDWLLLTKRADYMNRFMNQVETIQLHGQISKEFNLKNVWLGVTVENQAMANKRIPFLLKSPAHRRFLSVEPMLEPISFDGIIVQIEHEENEGYGVPCLKALDWIIVGGESGPGRRPFEADWARDIKGACEDENVAFFMKQMDKVKPIPADLMVRQFPTQ
jgi:protein gp37